jgi:hypothetical protein
LLQAVLKLIQLIDHGVGGRRGARLAVSVHQRHPCAETPDEGVAGQRGNQPQRGVHGLLGEQHTRQSRLDGGDFVADASCYLVRLLHRQPP